MVSSSKQSHGADGGDGGAALADPPDAQACARDVMDVVPSVMDALRGAMRAQVGEPLSVPQYRGLNFVARHDGCTVGDVAAFLGVTMPTASALVERLARAGTLRPQEDPADRRRQRLQLTRSGHALLVEIAGGAHRELAGRLAGCTPAELAALQGGLAVMRRLSVRAAPAIPPCPQPHQRRPRVRRA